MALDLTRECERPQLSTAKSQLGSIRQKRPIPRFRDAFGQAAKRSADI